MLGVFVKDSAFEHKICGVPSTFAQAMRRAISEKNDNLFLVIQGNLVARIRQVCPAAVVSVSLGGPFKDVFDSPNAKDSDVVVCLLSDETDIDSKQLVAIKKNGKASEKAEDIWKVTYKYIPL